MSNGEKSISSIVSHWGREHPWQRQAGVAGVVAVVVEVAAGAEGSFQAGRVAGTFLVFFLVPGFLRWVWRNQRL